MSNWKLISIVLLSLLVITGFQISPINSEASLVFTPPDKIFDLNVDLVFNSTGNFILIEVVILDQFIAAEIDNLYLYLFGNNSGYLPTIVTVSNDNNSIYSGHLAIEPEFPRYVVVRKILINFAIYYEHGIDFTSSTYDLQTSFDNFGSNLVPVVTNLQVRDTTVGIDDYIVVTGSFTNFEPRSFKSLDLYISNDKGYKEILGYWGQITEYNKTTGEFNYSRNTFDETPNKVYLSHLEITYYHGYDEIVHTLSNSTDYNGIDLSIIGGFNYHKATVLDIYLTDWEDGSILHNFAYVELDNITDVVSVYITYGSPNSTFTDSFLATYNSSMNRWEVEDVTNAIWPKFLTIDHLEVTTSDSYRYNYYDGVDYISPVLDRLVYPGFYADSDHPEVTNVTLSNLKYNGTAYIGVYLSDLNNFYLYNPPYPTQIAYIERIDGEFGYIYRQLYDPLIEDGDIVGCETEINLFVQLLNLHFPETLVVSQVRTQDAVVNSGYRYNTVDFTSPEFLVSYPDEWYSEVSTDTDTTDTDTTDTDTTNDVISTPSTEVPFPSAVIFLGLITTVLVFRKRKS
jgi:hypothetical protein